jgi:putative ABC transport system substrate-binding protein
VQRT